MVSRFYIYLFILTVVLGAISYTTYSLILERSWSIWSVSALFFFMLLTSLTYFITDMGFRRNSQTFFRGLYGSIGLRFLFSIFFIVIYLIINEVKDKMFIVEFLLFYLFFTMFEIFHLVAKLRSEKKRGVDATTD